MAENDSLKGYAMLRTLLRHAFLEARSAIEMGRLKTRGARKAQEIGARGTDLLLDLGCGATKRPGFVGIDISPEADIQWDILWGLPFADDSVLEIRSDHFLEHLQLPQVVAVLQECKRVLVSGGRLEFTVPHLDPYLDAYARRDLAFLKDMIPDIPESQEDLYNTCFDRISWVLHRSGEHKSLFDRESILAKVRLVGFTEITTRMYDAQCDINPRYSSIYVVAVK